MATRPTDLSKLFMASMALALLIVFSAGLYFVMAENLDPDSKNIQTTAIHNPSELTSVTLEAAYLAKAVAFAEAAEIYVQDGHSLRLNENQPTNCSRCFAFVFDHYGDPDVLYELTVRINDAGHPEWLEE